LLNIFVEYNIHNDNGLPILFVGKTTINVELQKHIEDQRKTDLVTLEDFEKEVDNKWYNHQYFSGAGSVAFKKKVITTIKNKIPNANFISLIHRTSSISPGCSIGNGVQVGPYTYIGPESVIGDYSFVDIGTALGHSGNVLNAFTFLAPNVILSSSHLAEGTWVGAYSKLDGVTTARYQQFKSHSRCSSIKFSQSGTYKHNRLIDTRNSLQLDICR